MPLKHASQPSPTGSHTHQVHHPSARRPDLLHTFRRRQRLHRGITLHPAGTHATRADPTGLVQHTTTPLTKVIASPFPQDPTLRTRRLQPAFQFPLRTRGMHPIHKSTTPTTITVSLVATTSPVGTPAQPATIGNADINSDATNTMWRNTKRWDTNVRALANTKQSCQRTLPLTNSLDNSGHWMTGIP